MTRIRSVTGGGQIFFCPGCESPHAVNTVKNGPHWDYNNDPASPTFSPSILITCVWAHVEPGWKNDVCHSFVKNGKIQFLNDCTHKLAGQTVDLPEWPYAPGTYGGVEDVYCERS